MPNLANAVKSSEVLILYSSNRQEVNSKPGEKKKKILKQKETFIGILLRTCAPVFFCRRNSQFCHFPFPLPFPPHQASPPRPGSAHP